MEKPLYDGVVDCLAEELRSARFGANAAREEVSRAYGRIEQLRKMSHDYHREHAIAAAAREYVEAVDALESIRGKCDAPTDEAAEMWENHRLRCVNGYEAMAAAVKGKS